MGVPLEVRGGGREDLWGHMHGLVMVPRRDWGGMVGGGGKV